MKYEEWKWSDSLLTSQETVDYQHQSLFRTINDLIRACNESSEPSGLLVEVALDELLKYAGHHFGDEEALMMKHNYKNVEAHKGEHKIFTEKMIVFKQKFDKGENVADELINYMHDWLIKHIMTLDKEAMKYCSK